MTFIRTPTWITAGFAQSKAGPGGSNFLCKTLHVDLNISEDDELKQSIVTPEQKERFRSHPEEYLNYRKDVESELNKRFKFVRKSIFHPIISSLITPVFNNRFSKTALSKNKQKNSLAMR